MADERMQIVRVNGCISGKRNWKKSESGGRAIIKITLTKVVLELNCPEF